MIHDWMVSNNGDFVYLEYGIYSPVFLNELQGFMFLKTLFSWPFLITS